MFYPIDPKAGTIIELGHDLGDKNIAKKVLIFPSGKGSSVVQVDDIYQLSTKGNVSEAMIIQHPETVLVSSAVIMEVPMAGKADPAFYDMVKNGDIICTGADHSAIEILSE